MKPFTLARIAPIAFVAALGLVTCIVAACAGSTEDASGSGDALTGTDACGYGQCGYGGYGYYGNGN